MEMIVLSSEEEQELNRLETTIEKNLVSFYEIGTALLQRIQANTQGNNPLTQGGHMERALCL